jgi:hypothetical protein
MVKRLLLVFMPLLLAGSSVPADPHRILAAADARPGSGEPTPQQVFEQRILPIFRSPDPSSCVQCHLAGVDLKNYILPSHEKTFVSLRDQGLIDLERPEKSRILALIQMGETEGGASLIHQKMRKMEYEAFKDWVEKSARDPRLRALPKLRPDEQARPKRPVEVIRHARTDRLLESFTNTIWAMRFRCMSCHIEGTAENQKLVKEHGPRVAWFKAGGPEATLAYLRTSRLIDIDHPEKSLLLRKPLNEAKHGGGKKFQTGDQGYKAFRAFLEDYARISKNDYADAAALPKKDTCPTRFGSDIWLKLAQAPPGWGDRLLLVTVHAWDGEKKTWESAPIATSDRVVWGKGQLWQHNLTLLAPRGSDRATTWAKGRPSLPRGRYLVKVYVDRDARLSRDWQAELGGDDFVGQVEVTSNWPEGYGRMTVAEAGAVRK